MESEGAPDKTHLPKGERRKEPRLKVDATAVLHLLDLAIRLRGRILDLSMSGCQFRTEDCYSLGIYRRVEIEFNVEGMPFRLSGVTQSIHTKTSIGVRFLDVSDRKRQQLADIVSELQETLAAEKAKEQARTEAKAAEPVVKEEAERVGKDEAERD
jgi:c-di-GMP-binding flagellar brake protein YcgR